MPQATLRANARTLPRRRPVSLSVRRRLEATLENLIALLDELDGDPDLEDTHDREWDPAELSGIADLDGMVEQLQGEPWIAATTDEDQRFAWHPGRGFLLNGDDEAAHAARNQGRAA